jgi:site-specific recombinase XerD
MVAEVKILKIEDYESVKKWFARANGETRYKAKTGEIYVKYMKLFCSLSNRTPNQLADVTSEEALKIQIGLATMMKEKLELREYSITQRINALHSFWRYNGVKLTDDIMQYSGTPWLMRERGGR